MNKNYNKAKEIYERWYHSIDMMPYDVKQEFFSYNIPSDIISSWHNEYIKELFADYVRFSKSENIADRIEIKSVILKIIAYYIKKSNVDTVNIASKNDICLKDILCYI